MATKKKEELPVTNSNVNTNNNTNNVNVNVKVEHPKQARRAAPPKKTQPNWAVRAIVIGIIGLVLSVLGFYLKRTLDGGHGSPDPIHGQIQSPRNTDFNL